MRVTIANFGGLVPRLSAHNLGEIHASIAHDVKLRNGRLEPWREPCEFASVGASAASFHLHGCCALSWDKIVTAAEFAPDWGRFYITGRNDYAEVVVVADKSACTPTYFRLGVPAPSTPPAAHGAGACGRAADARAYVYTYVNAWGEESAPSPPSNIITVEDGSTVTVTGISLPPEGYGIRYASLYRAATGFRQTDAKAQKPLTDYLYVATIEFPTTMYTDTVMMKELSLPLSTEKVRMPPEGLRNITRIEGVARLAGTTRNRVHLSENFQPHNWPVKYDLTLESNIVHMAALDQRLFVTTDTVPYVIDVSNCDDTKCTPVLDVGVPLPDISCGYASSAVMTPHGYIYSTPLGLVLIDPAAKWHLLTSKWFSEDDWAQIQPDTVRLGYWEGFLMCVTNAVTFILNIDGDPYGDMRDAELSTLSDSPVDLKTSNTGKLFMLQDGIIRVWNSGDTYRPFHWVSRELTGGTGGVGNGRMPQQGDPLGCLWSPVSAKVRTVDTEFTLISPVRHPAYRRKVIREKPFRLPRVGRHMWYKVELKGQHPVEFVDLGTAHFTVNGGV